MSEAVDMLRHQMDAVASLTEWRGKLIKIVEGWSGSVGPLLEVIAPHKIVIIRRILGDTIYMLTKLDLAKEEDRAALAEIAGCLERELKSCSKLLSTSRLPDL